MFHQNVLYVSESPQITILLKTYFYLWGFGFPFSPVIWVVITDMAKSSMLSFTWKWASECDELDVASCTWNEPVCVMSFMWHPVHVTSCTWNWASVCDESVCVKWHLVYGNDSMSDLQMTSKQIVISILTCLWLEELPHIENLSCYTFVLHCLLQHHPSYRRWPSCVICPVLIFPTPPIL